MNRTTLQLEIRDQIATLTLVPPEKKPTTLEMTCLAEIDAAISKVAEAAPRILIIQSAVPKFFCVGANIEVLKGLTADTIVPWVMAGHRIINRLEDLKCVTLAKVEGYALGGGLELAMGCDLIFASDKAKFGQTEAKLGFIPGWGGTRRFAERIGIPRAKRAFFTGEMINAPEAEAIGLVDFVGSTEALEEKLRSFIEDNRYCSPYAIQSFKKIIGEPQKAARDANAATEAFYSRGCLQDPDTLQRLNEFLNKG